MKKNNRKNVLLTLILSFVLSFSFAVSLPLNSAKALSPDEYNIQDYAWANYFNHDASTVSIPEEMQGQIHVSVRNYGYLVTFQAGGNEQYWPEINIDFVAELTGDVEWIFSSCVSGEYYAFNCDVVSTNIEDFEVSDVELSVGYYNENTGAFVSPIYECYSGDSSYFELDSDTDYSDTGLYVRLRVSLYPNAPLETTDTLQIRNLSLNHGDDIYEYTDYFYDLTSLPSNPPGLLNPDDDSSSEESSSEESSSDVDSSDDSSSDDSSDSGSHTPGLPDEPSDDYDRGFLDGLSYAERGIFMNASVDIVVNTVSNSVVDEEELHFVQPNIDGELPLGTFDITELWIYGGFDFSYIYRNFSVNYPTLKYAYLRINFDTSTLSVPALSFNLIGEGDSSLYTVNSNGNIISNTWFLYDEQGGYSFVSLGWQDSYSAGSLASATSYKSLLRGSSDTWYRPADMSGISFGGLRTPNLSSFALFENLKIYMSDNQYQSGFEAGQNSVNQSVFDDGFSAGKLEGLDEGFDEGFREGFNKAMSDDPYGFGDFMFTALDLPGRIVYNWLNFEFLGVNLAGLVATVLTIIVLGFVLKFKPF